MLIFAGSVQCSRLSGMQMTSPVSLYEAACSINFCLIGCLLGPWQLHDKRGSHSAVNSCCAAAVAGQAARAAAQHGGVLWARVHAVQRALRQEGGQRERGTRGACGAHRRAQGAGGPSPVMRPRADSDAQWRSTLGVCAAFRGFRVYPCSGARVRAVQPHERAGACEHVQGSNAVAVHSCAPVMPRRRCSKPSSDLCGPAEAPPQCLRLDICAGHGTRAWPPGRGA